MCVYVYIYICACIYVYTSQTRGKKIILQEQGGYSKQLCSQLPLALDFPPILGPLASLHPAGGHRMQESAARGVMH